MAFYLLDKPKGKTSADIVHEVKKATGANKVGHGGTLDPFATGLLIVATEGHTRLLSHLLEEKKTYEGELVLNQTSETLDPESEVVVNQDRVEINEGKLQNIINKQFLGKISQVPPRFSSIKVNGRKAYDLAREGVDFELEPVTRTIYEFTVKHIEGDRFSFKVQVSSGTYIRALARDLGEALGTTGMLVELRRTKVGYSSVEDASTIDNLQEVDVHKVLGLQTIEVTAEQMKDFMDGKTVRVDMDVPLMSFIAVNGDLELLVTSKSMTQYKIKKRIK
jgi:tRNA pseudouridine55 synthase